MRVAMNLKEDRGSSNAVQAGNSEVPRAPSPSGMSVYSPTSPVQSPRNLDILESAEELPPSADDGRRPGQGGTDDDAVRAGLASRNSEDRGRKRKPSQQAPDERASSSTRTHPAQVDRKRRSDGDDADRYDDSRDVEVGQVADKRKESAHRREKWDEDARAMSKNFRIEDCIKPWRQCAPASRVSMTWQKSIALRGWRRRRTTWACAEDFPSISPPQTQTATSGTSANMYVARRRSRRSESVDHT